MLKKILLIFRVFPLLAIAIPAVLGIRLIRPWLLVRWGSLNTWRLGHFAANTELYLCEQDAGIGIPRQRYADFFFIAKPICNQQLAKMWRRVLPIWPTWIRTPMHLANRLIPGGRAHLIDENLYGDRDVHNLLDRFPPHLSFTEEESVRGETGMGEIGIPKGTPFVCIVARDSAYLDTYAPRDWSYHNYRDSDIHNYLLAAEELADRGYYVIRMGFEVREPLKSDHPKIIDYATNGMRSDFMDIYLGAKCDFLISGGCGYDAVPLIFRRPIAYGNVVPLATLWTSRAQHLGITRHHYSTQKGRELTLNEIFAHGAGFWQRTSDFESHGIQLLENTPEEIRDIVVEMVERIQGTWLPQDEDDALQRKFWEIYPSDAAINGNLMHGEIKSHFGSAFLRNNPDWLKS